MMRAALLATLPLLAAGCFVESRPEPPSQLELTVGSLPLSRQPAANFAPWDTQGLFHLDNNPPGFPKLVQVSVETQDFTLATGSWPDPQLGVGEGEKPGGAVSLSLDVPAGAGRRLTALGFVIVDDAVVAYHESAPLSLDLPAGNTTEATLDMAPLPVGTAEITARCEEGNGEPWEPTEVALVDAKAFVLHPAGQLEVNHDTGALKVTFSNVPLGRPHWVRLTVSNGQLYTYIDKRTPTFSVSSSTEVLPVDVAIACKDLRTSSP